MKRLDFIILIIILTIASSIYLVTNVTSEEEAYFIVTNQAEVILQVDAYKNGEYSILGDHGKMTLEVKDGSIRVTESDCPLHHCENQGWIRIDESLPIICLPNGVLISSESAMYNQ